MQICSWFSTLDYVFHGARGACPFAAPVCCLRILDQVGDYSVRTPGTGSTSRLASTWVACSVAEHVAKGQRSRSCGCSRALFRLSPSTKHIPSGSFAFRFRGRPARATADRSTSGSSGCQRPGRSAGRARYGAAVARDGEQPGRERRPFWVERCQGSKRGQEHLPGRLPSWSASGGARLRISVHSGRAGSAPRGGGTTRRLPPARRIVYRGLHSWQAPCPCYTELPLRGYTTGPGKSSRDLEGP